MDIQIATVTQKGQVTIPLFMRKRLGIKPYSKVLLSVDKKTVKLENAPDILDLAGFISVGKGKNALKARQFMEKHYNR